MQGKFWGVVVTGATLLLAVSLPAQGPTVSKVEPPNWWANSSVNPVRVLVRGTNLAGARFECGRLSCDNVKVNERGTYAFVDVAIPRDATAGSYPLTVRTNGGSVAAPFSVAPRLAGHGRFQGFGTEDVMYLLMPDRFANGDPSNDDPAVSRGLLDRSKGRYYHGGDLAGVRQKLPYLKTLGVTTIWMNPIYDNNNGLNRKETYDNQPITDYHGYGATDLYAVDEHRGDVTAFKQLVDDAHAQGIKVVLDMVANHGAVSPVGAGRADADLVPRDGSQPPEQHVADVDAGRHVQHAGDATGHARRMVHQHPPRPQPGRSRGRALHHPEHALVGGSQRDGRDSAGYVAVRPALVLARLDDGDQERVSVAACGWGGL
ncbi:MAG: cyclomaltodextrinase N-terminal domain-containing protein [Gemmatimonadetes bacterium]|nr:cyclomaltodextrinase N-terminal domain-containing protein [Gemmatimonadota bacterium]